jgi:hypothetical protein
MSGSVQHDPICSMINISQQQQQVQTCKIVKNASREYIDT